MIYTGFASLLQLVLFQPSPTEGDNVFVCDVWWQVGGWVGGAKVWNGTVITLFAFAHLRSNIYFNLDALRNDIKHSGRVPLSVSLEV